MRQMGRALRVFIAVAGCPAVALAQDAPDFSRLAEFVRWEGVAASFLLVICAAVLLRLIDRVTTRFGTQFSSKRLVFQKIQTVASFFVYSMTCASAVGLSVHLDPTALTVIGSALAFAVGFALRDLVASFIAGITIMFDCPFQVGDRVSYGGQYGDIIKIGLRSTRMNTLDHNVITIPNNKIFTDVTSSSNWGALEMQVGMDFYIGGDQDVKTAVALVREACLCSPFTFLHKPVPVFARQEMIGPFAIFHIKARPYVYDCKYEKSLETDVHIRVHEALRAHGIALPRVAHAPSSRSGAGAAAYSLGGDSSDV